MGKIFGKQNKETINKEGSKDQEEIKELIINRLEFLSSDKKISIGSEGQFTKEQLIEHVQNNDEIGKKITEIELAYLRLLKKGIFYESEISHNEATT